MSVDGRQELGTSVLRDVSRSFYLTLRWLPRGMREATSVGYLLARASDTIADVGGETQASLALMDEFVACVKGLEREGFFERAAELAGAVGASEGEGVLMRRLGEVFAWLNLLEEKNGAAVRRVVEKIAEGQRWDLTRFPAGEVTAIEDEGEVLRYCYQVAGCVGEFWTEVGFGSDEGFARLSPDEMKRLGRSYGEGLQLINILRDEAEDELRGRHYLPGERESWIVEARAKVNDGLVYARALRGWRVRVATVLPALIGSETLDLLENAKVKEKVKVSRKVVKCCLLKAMMFR